MMFDLTFQRTHIDRADQERTVRSMSYNVPGHADRLNAHCKRVQREYFDSGLFYKEMHKAQGGSVND